MKPVLGYVFFVSALWCFDCASEQAGLDSESHFACDDNADCEAHSPELTCVARVCTARHPDGSAPMSTVPLPEASVPPGAGGRQAVSDDRDVPPVTDPVPPDARVPDARVPDARVPDSCDQCTKDLAPAKSLECFCGAHACASSLGDAIASGKFDGADYGCGLIVLFEISGSPGGRLQIFDRQSGTLVGAAETGDVFDFDLCAKPIFSLTGDEADQWGGAPNVDVFEGLVRICAEAKSCTLSRTTEGLDSGVVVHDPVCDLDVLLARSDGG